MFVNLPAIAIYYHLTMSKNNSEAANWSKGWRSHQKCTPNPSSYVFYLFIELYPNRDIWIEEEHFKSTVRQTFGHPPSPLLLSRPGPMELQNSPTAVDKYLFKRMCLWSPHNPVWFYFDNLWLEFVKSSWSKFSVNFLHLVWKPLDYIVLTS